MGYQEVAMQLGAIIFSDIRSPEKICKYFSCIPSGTVDKKLITEIIAFNVFIVDYSLYAFGSERSDYPKIKAMLFDNIVREFWHDLYSNGNFTDDYPILNNRLPSYANIYSDSKNNDFHKVNSCCLQLIRFAGLENHCINNKKELADFMSYFFHPAVLAFIKQIQEILNTDNTPTTTQSNNAKNMGCSLFILLAILAWLLS